jgi:hypothetical protein
LVFGSKSGKIRQVGSYSCLCPWDDAIRSPTKPKSRAPSYPTIKGRLDNITQILITLPMDQNKDDKLSLSADERYWLERKFPRRKWDEWGSPVGLSLGWAIFLVSTGIFIYLLSLAGIIR